MTATDELRALLDERGVKWTYDSGTYRWRSGRHPFPFAAWAFNDELLTVSAVKVTPAQAVDATLGRVTCRIEAHYGEWYCTGCGVMVGTCDPTSELCIDGNAIELWNYCPSCGREVVQS